MSILRPRDPGDHRLHDVVRCLRVERRAARPCGVTGPRTREARRSSRQASWSEARTRAHGRERARAASHGTTSRRVCHRRVRVRARSALRARGRGPRGGRATHGERRRDRRRAGARRDRVVLTASTPDRTAQGDRVTGRDACSSRAGRSCRRRARDSARRPNRDRLGLERRLAGCWIPAATCADSGVATPPCSRSGAACRPRCPRARPCAERRCDSRAGRRLVDQWARGALRLRESRGARGRGPRHHATCQADLVASEPAGLPAAALSDPACAARLAPSGVLG